MVNGIGSQIKVLREYMGYTQTDLVGDKFSITYLSRVERNHLVPSEKFMDYICERLGCLPEDFNLDFTEEKVDRIFERFKHVPSLSPHDFVFLKTSSNLSFSSNKYLQIYSMLIRHYIGNKQLQEAEKAYQQSVNFKNKNVKGTILAYYFVSCGNYFYYKQQFYDADQFYLQALSLVTDLDYLYPDILFNLSLTNQRTKNYFLSLSYSKEALRLYKQSNETQKVNEALIAIAQQCYYLDKLEDAVSSLAKAREYMLKQRNLIMLSKIEYSLGKIKRKMADIEAAKTHYNNYMAMLEEIGQSNKKVYVYRDLALMNLELKNLKIVDYYVNCFKMIHEEHPYPFIEVEMIYIMSQNFKCKGLEKEYENLIYKAYKKAKNLNLRHFVKDYGYELANYYMTKRNFKMAAEMFSESQR